jgi:serine protease AprX
MVPLWGLARLRLRGDNEHMRRGGLAVVGSATVSLVVLLAALSLPGTARGDGGAAAKVEPRLARIAEERGPEAQIDIILRGDSSDKLFRKYARKGKELSLVGGVSLTVKAKELDRIASDPDVSYVLADPPVESQGSGVVDYSKLSTVYPFADHAKDVWDKGYDGRGVGIAVIDSGVAGTPDFGSRLVQVTLPEQTWSGDDTVGHGSLVAGIAAGKSVDGKFIGVAPGATIFALNVNNPAGVHASDVIDALQWVYENAHAYNIRVVNLSLGETVAGTYQLSTLDLAVERVWAAGIEVVVSAGNGGPGAIDFAPANDPLVLTVGATDAKGTNSSGDDVVASFTATGTTVDGYAKPEMVAPGRLIASLLPAGTTLSLLAPAANRVAAGYATISGTSFAAPQVAGAAALLFQKHPDWSPDQVKWTLVQKAHGIAGGQTLRTLEANAAIGVGTPGLANQGVLALVCAPSSTCFADTGVSTLSSSWNSSSWNSSSWNSSSWNSSSWNSSSWNSSSWNSSSWNSSSWNSSSWNNAAWNWYCWD